MEIAGVEAGLQTEVWLCGGLNGEVAAATAAGRNVEVTPLSRYSQCANTHEGLYLGFAAVSVKEIRRGVRELAIVLDGLLKTPADRARRTSVR